MADVTPFPPSPVEGPSMFVRSDDYLALPRDPQPWLIQDLVPVGITNVYGKPKLGKSFLSMGMAMAIADPESSDYLGHEVKKHGNVLYLQLDTPREEWAGRIQTMKDLGMSFPDLYTADKLMVPRGFNVMNPEHSGWLRKEVTRLAPVLVIIDTIRESHDLDENDGTDMKRVVGQIVQATMPASVIILSHARKGSTNANGPAMAFSDDAPPDEDLMDGNRGSSYVAGRMDQIIKMTDKYITGQGRSCGKFSIRYQRSATTGRIELPPQERDRWVKDYVKMNKAMPGASMRELAQALADRVWKCPAETARSRVKTICKLTGEAA